MKKIKFVILAYAYDESFGVGSARIRNLSAFLRKKKYDLEIVTSEKNNSIYNWIWKCLKAIVSHRNTESVFILTLGPFYSLPIIPIFTLLYNRRIILDFRDPLSQNVLTGYGGTVKPRLIKGFILQYIEKLSYFCSWKTWVCTPGMENYFRTIFRSKNKLTLVTNGYTYTKDEIRSLTKTSTEKFTVKTYICIGKFASYGFNKAKQIINKIILENKNVNFQIILVGGDEADVLLKNEYPDTNIQIFPRLSEIESLALATRCDYGLTLTRNEDFEFGTKIFDYVGLGLTPYGIFDPTKNFYQFFKPYIDKQNKVDLTQLSREEIWKRSIGELVNQIKY